VSRRVRWFVYGFLGLIVVCGVAGIEAWPLTGFKLFSAIRSDERVSWQIVWVDPDDHEEVISLAELPVSYRNTTTILLTFDHLTPAARDEICDAWAQPHRDRGRPVESVRIYRKVSLLGPDRSPPTRELRWECGR
jgi:hypothetical protein